MLLASMNRCFHYRILAMEQLAVTNLLNFT